jgi:hypothetical protein
VRWFRWGSFFYLRWEKESFSWQHQLRVPHPSVPIRSRACSCSTPLYACSRACSMHTDTAVCIFVRVTIGCKSLLFDMDASFLKAVSNKRHSVDDQNPKRAAPDREQTQRTGRTYVHAKQSTVAGEETLNCLIVGPTSPETAKRHPGLLPHVPLLEHVDHVPQLLGVPVLDLLCQAQHGVHRTLLPPRAKHLNAVRASQQLNSRVPVVGASGSAPPSTMQRLPGKAAAG